MTVFCVFWILFVRFIWFRDFGFGCWLDWLVGLFGSVVVVRCVIVLI